jgi:hypothetical protein
VVVAGSTWLLQGVMVVAGGLGTGDLDHLLAFAVLWGITWNAVVVPEEEQCTAFEMHVSSSSCDACILLLIRRTIVLTLRCMWQRTLLTMLVRVSSLMPPSSPV